MGKENRVVKKSSKEAHAYRTNGEDAVVCGCGEKFKTDAEWRKHYEKLTTEKERARFEGRD
jgi:hypothetical protein